MEMAVDLYLAIRQLATALALVLASVFLRLWGADREQHWDPPVAKTAWESSPGDQEARRKWLQVEEVGVVEEGKEAAAKQQEEVAEEPSPMAEPSPVAAESISQQLPAKPH
ncbi:hypothetical protein AAES_09221 [Amazona aestiva]|uniref:Uncharacterized protein n=1 Tax=Amazona aestiva TaxID=12930 RepID=A0A0Q3XAM3_AMAAE|nr:hypothetical protein AAES_09221 [Amazona aestiva]